MENKSIGRMAQNIFLEEKFSELKKILASAKSKSYAGYSKFDALNSPFINFFTFNNAWLRFAWTQFIKISPINLRPLFGVEKSRNPKGIALFAKTYLSLYESTKNEEFLKEAKILLNWLIENKIKNYNNFCWGYNYTWQDIPPTIQQKDEPIIIVTLFVGEAFIHAYRITNDENYLKIAISSGDFITKDLHILHENETELAVSYTIRKDPSIVINIQALSAAFLSKLYRETKNNNYFVFAQKQMEFTMSCKTNYDAWYYTYPPEKSPIKHDNYHTGGILDALLEYIEETGDKKYFETYWQGLEYYKNNLFENNGAPRWMNNSKFPHDIHGSAQGIISFSKAGKYNEEYVIFANKIIDWTLKNLYKNKTSEFIYRKDNYFKWNYTLMHWCNGWMCRALSELIS